MRQEASAIFHILMVARNWRRTSWLQQQVLQRAVSRKECASDVKSIVREKGVILGPSTGLLGVAQYTFDGRLHEQLMPLALHPLRRPPTSLTDLAAAQQPSMPPGGRSQLQCGWRPTTSAMECGPTAYTLSSFCELYPVTASTNANGD